MNCKLCGASISGELLIKDILVFKPITSAQICSACWNSFERITGVNVCCYCGREQADTSACADCVRWEAQTGEAVLTNRPLFKYNETMQRFMEVYKFQGDYQLRLAMRDCFSQHLRQNKRAVFVPIPMSNQHRGFNQVTALIKQQSQVVDLLELIPDTRIVPQSHKNRAERMNSEQPFKVRANLIPKIMNKNVVLIDDVYTTGRTLHHAFNLISSYTEHTVSSMTLAR
ncbi:ComF family protein [Periweissella cryptocerci]|uniref:ComF family protein n=1 Tax=Periweissella cryptocerci TaxID=2506420 RepID=A0A4P6YTB4_9LACO|nr:ComF family protein [Periweissella cryptocerci]QBO35912.1 ComF family protein [Periweissella cryptocerci]